MEPFLIGKDIAINCWKEIPNIKDYVHFYTHLNNNLASAPAKFLTKIKPIYTSPFLAWYLLTCSEVHRDAFIAIEFGVEHTIHKNGREITFEFVTSNSLQPHFMILFKSEGGDELFTGNCKFSEETLSIRSLLPYLSSKSLNKLYYDDSYINCSRIPSFSHIIHAIIKTIKAHKNKIVYISANVLGNEHALSTIAQALNKKIYVCPEKYAVLGKLGIDQYFTTDPSITYIRTIHYSRISIRKVLKRNKLLGPSITIVLSLNAFLSNQDHSGALMKNGIIFFPLTSLNTPSELEIMKKISTKGYVTTNLRRHMSNSGYDVDEYVTSNPENSNSSNQPRRKKYSKYKTSQREVVRQLTEILGPEYCMTLEDYAKWKRNNFKKNSEGVPQL